MESPLPNLMRRVYVSAMNPRDVNSDVEIDADGFASVTAGAWAIRPPSTWRYRGLCWHQDAYAPGRIILAKEKGFRYGVGLTALKADMADAGIMVSAGHPSISVAPTLCVDSIHLAIRRLAAHVRSNSAAKIIAITGSVGKTSSCYLLRHLLDHKGRVSTNGQFNYPGGIVCETCNLGEVDYAVIEASLQGLGEATAILTPQVALLTNISPVHIDLAGSLLALAEKKASLFGHLARGGTAVINRDIAHFDRVSEIARATGAAVLTFGEHASADFQLTRYDLQRHRVYAHILGERIEYQLGLPGRHMALNSLGALAAAHAAGVDWKDLIEYCASARMVAGRGTCEKLKIAGIRVSMIDDAYNASPAAMKAAFAMLAATTPSDHGRRIAVLADMLELGEHSVGYHQQLAEPLLASGVGKVYLAGEMMAYLWRELPQNLCGSISKQSGGLLWPLLRELRNGDVVLLKGSHGTEMHKLAADLRYLSLFPYLHGAGPKIFILLRSVLQELGSHVPRRVSRWITWHLEQFMKHMNHGAT